jgi:hypothetical protein
MDNMKALSSVMGEEQAKKVLKLTNKYDKYVVKFRKEINALLDPVGFEVKTGVAFVKKETSKKSE